MDEALMQHQRVINVYDIRCRNDVTLMKSVFHELDTMRQLVLKKQNLRRFEKPCNCMKRFRDPDFEATAQSFC